MFEMWCCKKKNRTRCDFKVTKLSDIVEKITPFPMFFNQYPVLGGQTFGLSIFLPSR